MTNKPTARERFEEDVRRGLWATYDEVDSISKEQDEREEYVMKRVEAALDTFIEAIAVEVEKERDTIDLQHPNPVTRAIHGFMVQCYAAAVAIIRSAKEK